MNWTPSWLIHAPRNRKLRTNKPPQKKCKDRDRHVAHLFIDDRLLAVWSCQGRGRTVEA